MNTNPWERLREAVKRLVDDAEASTRAKGAHLVASDLLEGLRAALAALPPAQTDAEREQAIEREVAIDAWSTRAWGAKEKGEWVLSETVIQEAVALMRSAPQKPAAEEPKPASPASDDSGVRTALSKASRRVHAQQEVIDNLLTKQGALRHRIKQLQSYIAKIKKDQNGQSKEPSSSASPGSPQGAAVQLPPDGQGQHREGGARAERAGSTGAVSPASDWRERFEASRNSTAETLCLRDGLIAAEDRIAAVEDRLAKIERGAP